MSLFIVYNSMPKFSSLMFIPLKVVSTAVFYLLVLGSLWVYFLVGWVFCFLFWYLISLGSWLCLTCMLELIFEKQFVGVM